MANQGEIRLAKCHDAARQGDLDAVVQLIKDGVPSYQVDKRTGDQLLHAAAEYGHGAIVAAVLKAGGKIDLNAINTRHMSPLSLAASNGHIDVCLALIAAGARVGMPTSAEAAGDPSGPAGPGGGISPLHAAAAAGATETFKLLKSEGVSQVSMAVDAPDFLGRSPLHLAVAGGHLPMVEEIVGSSNSTQMADQQGRGPLHYAALAGNTAAAQILLRANFDGGAKDSLGYTTVQYAAAFGHDELVRVLVDDYNAVLEPFATEPEAADERGGGKQLQQGAGVGSAEGLKLAEGIKGASLTSSIDQSSASEGNEEAGEAEDGSLVHSRAGTMVALQTPPWSILAEWLAASGAR